MKRAPLSLAAVAAALAAVTGAAALTAPAAPASGGPAPAAARQPVERSVLVCPTPSASDIAETVYTSITPGGAGQGGSARLTGATKEQKQLLELKEPGKPAGATASGAEGPALTGTADGALAPGWTAQQTTKVAVGQARGLLGVACTAPGTEFWFPGASTAKGRQDYVHLTNADDTPAVVDIELFGPEGRSASDPGTGENIKIGPKSSVPVLLNTLSSQQQADVTAHVTTRSGRVGASVQVLEDGVGSDWLPASTAPAGSLVLPGIPADATSVRLVAFAPGEEDADLRLQLAGPGGSFTPAGNEQLHVKSRMTATLDLKDLTRGEPGSLVLTPADPKKAAPVVAALRVVRGSGAKQELGFIPAAGPVGARATNADNRTDQGATTLSLTAVGADATVKVTASPGTEGGRPASQEYKVKAGTTLAVAPPPVPDGGGKGAYALTVETVSGGPVHAARTLSLPHDGIPFFTVQPLTDDHSTVSVPKAVQDLRILSN
ncbi:hypothetical protein DEJ50_12675 [Streptomyces venezuelae]|uniref:Secreted protein n=1 Tax=Streptomyces venezuelae TaxID=54571 RepID=A0A5P2D5X4_STRVZ|nr:DUF5719 family protein [Streptomyces venezuelae]QES48549.1 hypothetical protein DEJ50_12675 [Streptomyces venezuelae]